MFLQQKNMAFKIWNISIISLLGIITTRCYQSNFKGKVTYAWFESEFQKKYDHNLNCPFCSVESEYLDHIFICPAGIYAPKSIRSIKLEMLGTTSDITYYRQLENCYWDTKSIGR